MTRLSVLDLAMLEGKTPRQIQRYISVGLGGHRLPALRVGRALTVSREDYLEWRRLAGLECAEEPVPAPAPAEPATDTVPLCQETAPEPVAPVEPHPARLSWPLLVACPGGPITNVPSATSGSFPHPDLLRKYAEQEARDLLTLFRGRR